MACELGQFHRHSAAGSMNSRLMTAPVFEREVDPPFREAEEETS